MFHFRLKKYDKQLTFHEKTCFQFNHFFLRHKLVNHVVILISGAQYPGKITAYHDAKIYENALLNHVSFSFIFLVHNNFWK